MEDWIGMIKKAADLEYSKLSWWSKNKYIVLLIAIILGLIGVGVIIGKFLL